ncbi:MAG TPA: hypothetical protein VJH22_00350 [Candidatus Nanoarchaeia archaeon]|nr:hypothetical protein [Candidatus Nanoarchaeia archaeon]
MKTINAIVMLALLVVSIVPGAIAQETVATGDAATTPTLDDTSADADTDVNIDDDTDATEGTGTRDKVRKDIAMRKPVVRKEVRQEIREGRPIADIRAQMQAKLDLAIERCKTAPEPSKCENAIKNRQETLARLNEQDFERAQKIEARLVEHAKKLTEERKSAAFTKFKGEDMNARVVARAKIEAAHERYANAKQNYEEARDNYQGARDEFRAKAKEARECTADSAECNEKRAKAKEQANAQLKHALEAVTKQLEKVKSRVEASTDLTEEEAAEILAKIDAKLALAAELSVKVSALTAESTKEEISALAQSVRAVLKDLDAAIKNHAGRAINARIGNVILHTKQLSTRLEHTLLKLAEQGKDTSTVEPLIAEFNAQLDLATTAYTSAKAKFSAGDVKGAHEQVRAAHAALKTAHDKLKEIVRAIHALDGNEELEESLANGAVDAEVEAAAEVSASA